MHFITNKSINLIAYTCPRTKFYLYKCVLTVVKSSAIDVCVIPKSQYYTVSCRHIYYAILILILYITTIRILLLIEIIMPLCQYSNAVITVVNMQFYNNIATHRLNKLPEASTTSLSASQQVHRHHLHTNVQYGFLLIRGRKREMFPRCALHRLQIQTAVASKSCCHQSFCVDNR